MPSQRDPASQQQVCTTPETTLPNHRNTIIREVPLSRKDATQETAQYGRFLVCAPAGQRPLSEEEATGRGR